MNRATRPPPRSHPSSSTTHPVWTFSRTRRTTRTRTNQFMVPMRVRKQVEAFHELQGRAGILPAPVGNADGTEPLALARSPGRLEACPTLGPPRFMVPMHAQVRKEALPAAQGEGVRDAVLSTLRSTPKGNEEVRHNSQW